MQSPESQCNRTIRAAAMRSARTKFLLVRDDELEAAEQEGRSRPYSRTPAKSAIEQDDEREPANVQAPEPLFRPRPAGSGESSAMPAEPQTTGPIPASAAPAVPTPTPIENNRRSRSIASFHVRKSTRAISIHLNYVIPRDQVGEEAFAVIRDATRAKDVVGMGRVVLARRERPIIVEPMGNGIRGITLRHSRMSGTKPPTCQHSKCVT